MPWEPWKTSISSVKPNEIRLRGYSVVELMEKLSFGDVVFLLMAGELPRKGEGRLIEAILVAAADHSLAAPSTDAARIVASCGVPLPTAVAAGILALGDFHGGAVEGCAELLLQADLADLPGSAARLVGSVLAQGKRFPGYGHPVHTRDPRAQKLLEMAESLGLRGPYTELASLIETELSLQSGRELSMNIDGAIAALMLDMGIDWRLGKAFYVIARSAGLCAHVHEEQTRERPFRSLPYQAIQYSGPSSRTLRDP
jgi:citrate synthase